MSERKVLNRYFPPDFDPKKLDENKKLVKRLKPKKKNGGIKKKKFLNIRMLYPFTIRCNGCDIYHYVGTKFNSKVEKVQNESYLDIPIWRFYGRCTQCGNTIIFKTNPKSGDYILESGATRNYIKTGDLEVKTENDKSDIETKVINTANEIKTLDELELLRTVNKRLMNREVVELNALKNLMNSDITEETELANLKSSEPENSFHQEFSNMKHNNGEISDNETQFIFNHINKHYNSKGNTQFPQNIEISINNNRKHLVTLDSAVLIKEKKCSSLSYFDCYDSEDE